MDKNKLIFKARNLENAQTIAAIVGTNTQQETTFHLIAKLKEAPQQQ